MVDKWAFETNSFVLPLTKSLVTVDQIQEVLLSSRMKTTATSINEMWVQCLTDNVVFQMGLTSSVSPGKILHYCISPFVWKTLLLQIP